MIVLAPNGHRQEKNFRKWKISGTRCPHCKISRPENEISDFLYESGINYLRNTRSILDKGKELDFYFPDLNKAIEFNGDYWHCNYNLYNPSFVHPQYKVYARDVGRKDRKKKLKCRKKGIELLVIGEDNGRSNKKQVKNKITHFLSIT